MKNQVQKGDAVNVTLTAAITSGSGLLLGAMFGVAAVNGNIGDVIALWLVGVFTLNKNSAEAWTLGQAIYWDPVAKQCTVTATNNVKIGVATAPAANPSATGNVRLNGAF
jgi:predicted RecA/RadA family phage recombinase